MKYKIIFLSSLFISLNLFSYTLYPVGEVESRQWNDTWEKFYDYPLTIHAGTSEDTTQKAIRLTIRNKIFLTFSDTKGVKKSTLICWPFFNKGPSNGKTNQLTKTGGSSTNHANPVPVINLVLALKNSAATIIKMINIARANEAEAKKLLTFWFGMAYFLV